MSADPTNAPAHLDFPCRSCGAKLVYVPGTEHLECPYCGEQQPVERAPAAPIAEYSLEEARGGARTVEARELLDSAVGVQCGRCGARVVMQGQARSCAFCDSPVVVDELEGRLHAPESLLPFKVDAKRAQQVFVVWLKGRWFAPSDLARRARRDGLSGVYLPYWTYDAGTATDYTGMRGTYYTVTETYRDSNGQMRTRQVRRTRWSPASGTVRVPFDDVLVAATRSLPRPLLEELEPWDLPALTPFKPSFLSGFAAERYQVDLEEGFGVAQGRMEPVIRAAIHRDIGGDEQRILSMHVHYHAVRFKHLLLPLWISSFRYGDRLFRFVVNARTGEGAGERPYSPWKIALAAAAAIAVAAILFLLFDRG